MPSYAEQQIFETGIGDRAMECSQGAWQMSSQPSAGIAGRQTLWTGFAPAAFLAAQMQHLEDESSRLGVGVALGAETSHAF